MIKYWVGHRCWINMRLLADDLKPQIRQQWRYQLITPGNAVCRVFPSEGVVGAEVVEIAGNGFQGFRFQCRVVGVPHGLFKLL